MTKKYKPTTRDELRELVKRVDDLSLIDTSAIDDMSYVFYGSTRTNFSGIETWDVSNVVNMDSMFAHSFFNEDISHWNTSKVIYMSYMFYESDFNQNISSWNVKKVEEAEDMFFETPFNKKLSALSKQNPLFKNRFYLGLED